MSGTGAGGGSTVIWRAKMAAASGRPRRGRPRRWPGGPLDRPGADGDPGQAGQQPGRAGEGDLRAGQGGHLGQARRQRAAADAQLLVAGSEPALAFRAVVPRQAQRDRAEHGGDRLVPAAGVGGLPAAAAVGPRAAYPSSPPSTASSSRPPEAVSAARIACSSTPSPSPEPSIDAARPASLPTSAAATSSSRAASPPFPLRAGGAPRRL